MWNASNIGADLDGINIGCPKCDIPAPGFHPEEFDLGKAMNDFKGAVDNRQAYELRDWFAGMAMQGVISDDDRMNRVKCNIETEDNELHGRTITGVVAEVSYKHADAMMDAREEPDATNT